MCVGGKISAKREINKIIIENKVFVVCALSIQFSTHTRMCITSFQRQITARYGKCIHDVAKNPISPPHFWKQLHFRYNIVQMSSPYDMENDF